MDIGENNIILEDQENVNQNQEIGDDNRSIDMYHKALNKYFNKKRLYYQKLEKNVKKCISCSNTSGTVFEYKDGTYIARCGNISSPCKLNVAIRRGKYKSVNNMLQEEINKYNNSVQKVIDLKMDYLFQLISEEDMIKKYQNLKDELEMINASKEKIQKIQIARKEEMKYKTIEFEIFEENFKNVKERISESIEVYRKDERMDSRNAEIKNMIQIYKNELIPLLNNKHKDIYSYYEMESNVKGDLEMKLVKKQHTMEIDELEIVEPKVLSEQY